MGIAGGVTLFVALLFTVLAVDTGRLWAQRRDLQTSADMAALASARFTGCGSTLDDAQNAARATAAANGLNVASANGGATLTLQRGMVTNDAQQRRVFTPVNVASDQTNGTQVVVTRQVPASLLMGGVFTDPVALSASATAMGGPNEATFSVGSLLAVSPKQADFITRLFRGILGNSSLNLTADALTGLAGTTVNLVALQAVAGAASIDELLTRRVPLSQLLTWLTVTSPSAGAARDALNQLVTVSASSGITLTLGQVLKVQLPATQATASAQINVLDLVNVGLMVGAAQQNGGVISINAGIANLVNVSLKVLNPPQIAIGPAGKSSLGTWCTEARSSQLALVGAIKIPLIVASVDLALRADLGVAQGHLAGLSVSPGNATGVISTGSTGVSLRLTDAADTGPGKITALFIPLITVGLNLPLLDAQGGNATFTVPSRAALPTEVQSSSTVSQSLAGLIGSSASLDLRVAGIKVPDVLGLVAILFNGIVSPFVEGILDPLLSMLGLNFGLVKTQLIDIAPSMPTLVR